MRRYILLTLIAAIATTAPLAEEISSMIRQGQYWVLQDFGLQMDGDPLFISKGIVLRTEGETEIECPENGIVLMNVEEGAIPPAYFCPHSVSMIVIQNQSGGGVIFYNVDAREMQEGQIVQKGDCIGKVKPFDSSENYVFQIVTFQTDAPFGELKYNSLLWPHIDGEEASPNNYEVILVDPRRLYDLGE